MNEDLFSCLCVAHFLKPPFYRTVSLSASWNSTSSSSPIQIQANLSHHLLAIWVHSHHLNICSLPVIPKSRFQSLLVLLGQALMELVGKWESGGGEQLFWLRWTAGLLHLSMGLEGMDWTCCDHPLPNHLMPSSL